MRTFIFVVLFFLHSLPLFGSDVNEEVRIRNIGATISAIESKTEVTHTNYAVEVAVRKHLDGRHNLARMAFKYGSTLPPIKGIRTSVYLEAGENLQESALYPFAGAGIKATIPVRKKLTVGIGYRHRHSIHSHYLNEERVNVGITCSITRELSAGVLYYQSYNRARLRILGIAVTRRF